MPNKEIPIAQILSSTSRVPKDMFVSHALTWSTDAIPDKDLLQCLISGFRSGRKKSFLIEWFVNMQITLFQWHTEGEFRVIKDDFTVSLGEGGSEYT